jgi:N-sulfoglucosamine sulfohydrolase-like protein
MRHRSRWHSARHSITNTTNIRSPTTCARTTASSPTVQFYATGEDYTELFDLQEDPRELTSVFDDPAHAATQKELQSELARLRKELQVPE